MDQVFAAELQSMIACGELDCLKNCCETQGVDGLRKLRSVLEQLSDRDIATFAKMLCGCAVPKAPSGVDATGSACIAKIASWFKENRRTVTAVEVALDVLDDFSETVDLRIHALVKAVKLGFEQLEDLAISTDGTFADEAIGIVCQIIATREDLVNSLKAIVPDFAGPAVDALDGLRTMGDLALACCKRVPAGPAPPPQLPSPTEPGPTNIPIVITTPVTTVDHIPATDQPTTNYPYPYPYPY